MRGALESFHARHAARFARLFLAERPLLARRAEREALAPLVSAGLVERLLGPLHAPRARVVPFLGRFVATDLRRRPATDQVFSLMFEQCYFARHLRARAGDRVLEVGVGSGVNALRAAEQGARVVGVDLNPRALEFSRFNEALSPPPQPLDLRLGSLLDPIGPDERFDLLLCNPPFEPVPPGATWYLHSAAGPDGMDFLRALLRDAPRALAPGGRVEMVTWSPSDGTLPLAVALLLEALPDHHVEAHDLLEEPIDPVLDRFRGAKGYDDWRADLAARGLTRLHMLYLRAARGEGPRLTVRTPTEAIREAREAARAID